MLYARDKVRGGGELGEGEIAKEGLGEGFWI